MAKEDEQPKPKKSAAKKTSAKKAAVKDAPPKVTKEKVMVAVDIETEGAASVARYSGLFFVFAGAVLSLYSLGGMYVETEEFIARTEFAANERVFSYLASRHLAASIAASQGAAVEEATSTDAGEEALLFADFGLADEAEDAAAAAEPVAPPAASPALMPAQAAAPSGSIEPPRFFSESMSALITSFAVVMLGLLLIVIAMYLSRRKDHAAPRAGDTAPAT